MVILALLTSLTDEGRKYLKDYPGQLLEYNRVLETLGVRVLGQYAVVGQYDLTPVVVPVPK